MRLPVISGIIRRRLLINFRVRPEEIVPVLPGCFRPKLHNGYAIAGVCIIRLEKIRPKGIPACLGITSENAAHRIAVEWGDPDGTTKEGVFIPRRDTGSTLNAFAGGRLFPGEHHRADFAVADDGDRIDMRIVSRDGLMRVNLQGRATDVWPADSCFRSLSESSDFFKAGSIGYSVTKDCCRLDGIRLETEGWGVRPMLIESVESSWFSDSKRFPSAKLDHVLVMRDQPHRWCAERDLVP